MPRNFNTDFPGSDVPGGVYPAVWSSMPTDSAANGMHPTVSANVPDNLPASPADSGMILNSSKSTSIKASRKLNAYVNFGLLRTLLILWDILELSCFKWISALSKWKRNHSINLCWFQTKCRYKWHIPDGWNTRMGSKSSLMVTVF